MSTSGSHVSVTAILDSIAAIRGTNDKLRILSENKDNQLLRRLVEFTYDPHKNFGISSRTFESNDVDVASDDSRDDVVWAAFLDALDSCDRCVRRGSDASDTVWGAFTVPVTSSMRSWISHVLDRHLNCGVSIKSMNSVWPNLIKTFECQLADKWDIDVVSGVDYVAVEPKLDGTRIVAIVKGGVAMLYTRNGKHIVNFDSTVGKELVKLVGQRDLVFDGELMSTDFSATMGQLFRKKDVDTSTSFYNVFDVMEYEDWVNRSPKWNTQKSREVLEDLAIDINCKYVKMIERHVIRPHQVVEFHKEFRNRGFEGTMVKLLDRHYNWGRNDNVMKLKDWYDFDLVIDSFVEGTGRYRGHLGSFVVKYEGKSVKIERGLLTKDEAKHLWENRSSYRGKCIEVQAQEVTKDGSLRFPKFIRFRPDKD